jgi:hypothetical protein
MSQPVWNDAALKLGTMVRTALWLVSEVGVGNVFTKDAHRQAFSGVTQADRRLRDLRKYGWVIHTSIEDVSLSSNEQRLVSIGAEVWVPASRRGLEGKKLTAKQRREVFEKTDYQCCVCGIAGGESYADAPEFKAILSLRRTEVKSFNGEQRSEYWPECKRCLSGKKSRGNDVGALIGLVDGLAPLEKDMVIRLLGSKDNDSVLAIWRHFRSLTDDCRQEIRDLVNARYLGS